MKLIRKCKILLPPVITLAIYLVILLIKHIYPFGNLTVDYYDMAQQIAAFYCHIFDVLHGEKSLFLDPYTALSVNMAMSTSGCSHLSIFNLFFLFVKRNMILESLSYFLGLKMMVMSITMYIYISYFNKSKRIPYFVEVMFSVGYAFCGFVMVLYVTIQWMDIAALFPLIMFFMHKLLEKGKSAGYIVTLTLALISSYYISFMILIFIVLIVGLELWANKLFKDKKADNKMNLSALFFETVISILLSSFILIPQLKQTLISARFNNENGGGLLAFYLNIINTVKPAYTTRWFSLLNLSFAFAVIVACLIRLRKIEKKEYFRLLFLSFGTLFIMLSELFVESINLFWHFGSYVQYPIRNGFIIYFAVTVLAAGLLQEATKYEEIKLSGFSHIVILVVVLITGLCLGIRKYSELKSIPVRNLFHILAIIMAVSFAFCLYGLFSSRFKLIGAIPAIMIAEIILYGVIFIGKPIFVTGYSEEPEQEGEYIRICNQLSDAFEITPDDAYDYLFNRVKNPDESLNSNYGLVLRRPAISNWTHLLNPGLSDSLKKLGYTVQFTRLLDSGGTVFSDALFGVKNIITNVPQNEKLYRLIDQAEIEIDHITHKRMIYYYYESRFTLPFGMVASMEPQFEGDTVDVLNSLYFAVSGKEEKIAKWVYNNEIQNRRFEERKGNTKILKHSFNITGNRAVYYFGSQVDTDDYNTEISINGEKVLIPSIKEYNNYLYPAHFNNNAVFLGVFEDEPIEVDIVFHEVYQKNDDRYKEKIESDFSPNILSIDLDLLGELSDELSSKVEKKATKYEYHFSALADEGDCLLIPISYDKGYNVTVNNVKKVISSAGDVFLSVPLDEGENIVSISFLPDGMKLGIIISLGTLLLAACGTLVHGGRIISTLKIPFIENIYMAGVLAVFLIMYIIPIIYGVIKCIV